MTDEEAAILLRDRLGPDLVDVAIAHDLQPADCVLICIIKTDSGNHVWVNGMVGPLHESVVGAIAAVFAPLAN